ncbi:unnamed protein product, partial [Linum tenue]
MVEEGNLVVVGCCSKGLAVAVGRRVEAAVVVNLVVEVVGDGYMEVSVMGMVVPAMVAEGMEMVAAETVVEVKEEEVVAVTAVVVMEEEAVESKPVVAAT